MAESLEPLRTADTRRDFLMLATAFAASAAGLAQASTSGQVPPTPTDPLALESTTVDTIREAEKLHLVTFTPAEREQMLRTIGEQRKLVRSLMRDLPNELAPAVTFNPRVPGTATPRITAEGDPRALNGAAPSLPGDSADIAFSPLTDLSRWVRDRTITSTRLTEIYLERIERLAPKLLCCITVTRELALAQAKEADAEIAAGKYRGPLHGVPYGLKDIIDTAGIPTTWGAEPWKDRIPQNDAVVTRRLREAGAVLIAKTAVGALAYGDIWFGGTCKSPWDLAKGSSGSSAGSASGVAAGLFGFAIGSETLGSIVSPCDRCGCAGLRPTFGRVARTGVMSLVWSMDKVGVLARSIADTGLVLDAIRGSDIDDPSSVDEPFTWNALQDAKGLLVGYDPLWCRDNPYADSARAAVDAARRAGCEVIEIGLPRIDPTPALITLYAEAASAFAELTRSNADDTLSWQADEAWPNTFRSARFLSAVDLVTGERMRRRLCRGMFDLFDQLHAVIAPPFAGGLLSITNLTGQPCAAVRAGFDANGEPQAVTVMSRIFDEGTALRVASAIERELGIAPRRPPVVA
jgi:Asp-tRNA(Asn)/Glu-tRNA(Gln) amidotransferase A subunit family amidase